LQTIDPATAGLDNGFRRYGVSGKISTFYEVVQIKVYEMQNVSARKETDMSENANFAGSCPDAVFLGWQETLSGAIFPLYTITVADHPLYHSTVTDATLRRLNLQIPQTPPPYPETVPAPWQSLGVALTYPKTAREALEIAGLDFTVVKDTLEMAAGSNQAAGAIVRTDTGDVLGIVSAGHEPIQNRDAFTFFDNLVDRGEAIYEAAGKLGHGERIWILAKLPGCITVHGNDIVDKYLLLINSHGGSAQVQVKLTPIRVVCNNTLTSALKGAGDIKIRHTPNTQWNFEQANRLLGLSNALYEQLDVVFNDMASKKITEAQLQAYVKALVPDNEETEFDAGTENIRQCMLQLNESGRGAALSRGTWWGAFNSVTEYTDHMMLGGNSETRLNSIWFGRGEQLKVKAFQLAEQMMQA
jgi:phage/plasmid-like protein (TIGR03299 family)